MKNGRRIIVYIATSTDGYIARHDGNVDWLNRPRQSDDYGMDAFLKSIDTVIWGRKTYEPLLQKFAARKTKATARSKKPRAKTSRSRIKNYIFSRQPPETFPPGVEFVTEPIKTFTKRLRSETGKDIWMMGGAGIIGSFLDEGEIDEFIIHVIPIFIGDGIPLVQPRHRSIPLELLSTKSWPDGVVRLHYAVQPQSASRTVSKRARRVKNNKKPSENG
ncbi:MAG: dihydrofolate reductase family protein [Pyrinomonadaceae bacterium]|nr:dihydrofolate reductase family protein [Pyrinomonadaceae bacterium]